MSIHVQSFQYLPEFRYRTGDTWEIDPDGVLHIYDENGTAIATHARGSWDSVKLVEDQAPTDEHDGVNRVGGTL